MSGQSIGMIETWGFVAAVEALDAGMKAAKVASQGCIVTPSALVTVSFTGDVSAVQTAVLAGVQAARKVGRVVSHHVIPRPDAQLGPDLFDPARSEPPVSPRETAKKSPESDSAKVSEGPGTAGRTASGPVPAEKEPPAPAAGTKDSKTEKRGKKKTTKKVSSTRKTAGGPSGKNSSKKDRKSEA